MPSLDLTLDVQKERSNGLISITRILPRSFEQTKEFTQSCYRAWQNRAYPVQLIWGDKDPFLTWEEKGKEFEEARPGVPITKVESKHFLQEEAYEIIAAKVKELIT